MNKKVLSVPEAAVLVGLTERACWQQIYRGRFPFRRWGNKVVILQEELEEFLKNLPGPTLEEVTAQALLSRKRRGRKAQQQQEEAA